MGGAAYESNIFTYLDGGYNVIGLYGCRDDSPPPCEETTREGAEAKALRLCEEGGSLFGPVNDCQLKAHWKTGQCFVWTEVSSTAYKNYVTRWIVVPDSDDYAEYAAGVLGQAAIDDCEKEEEEQGRYDTSCGLHPIGRHSAAVCDRDGEWEQQFYNLRGDLPTR